MSWDPLESTKVKAFPDIPGYKIVKKVGKGAKALVFKGIHEKSHKNVAIKVLKPSLQEDEDSLRRFHRELKVVSSLSHPYIIKIFDVKKAGQDYIIMEYLKCSLKNILQSKGGKLSKKDALIITRKLAKALEYAHNKGVIHRDIKPANILFRKNGQPVLADFGLVKNLNSKSEATRLFTIIGTPHYMSPEQWKSEKVDHLSDIYSLGVVLFEMLSGKLPYDGVTHNELYRQHTDPSIPIPDLSIHAKDIQHLINLMMAKDKSKRIDALRVRQMIEEILAKKKSIKNWQKQSQFLSYLMVGMIVAFIILVILIFFLFKP